MVFYNFILFWHAIRLTSETRLSISQRFIISSFEICKKFIILFDYIICIYVICIFDARNTSFKSWWLDIKRLLTFLMIDWQEECINQIFLPLYVSISRSYKWRIKNKNYREHHGIFSISCSYLFVDGNKKLIFIPGFKNDIISFLTHTGHTTYHPMQFLRIYKISLK